MAMKHITRLPDPQEIMRLYPLSDKVKQIKKDRDEEIKKVFTGESEKFLLIIGPCSADKEDSVLDYLERLRVLQDKVHDKILILPRIYTNKPRTNGDGYKGMIHQPDPNGTPDMMKGLLAIRGLHTSAIENTGFVCADEMLYPENYAYLSDVLGYVAIGARSVENQQHRLVSSGIDTPVGMKNPTSGDFSVMMNSIYAAQRSHTFIYRGNEVETTGNPLCHAILRGSVNKHGQTIPNYHYEDLNRLYEAYVDMKLENPAVIIDANHSNSGKKFMEQIRISKEVVHSCKLNDHIKKMVKGLMIESYIEDGNQPIDGGIYGKSITDPCLGWDKSERLVLDLAELL